MNRVPGVASSGNFRIDATLASLSWGPPISSENPADGHGEQLPQGDRPLVRGHLGGMVGKELGQGRIQGVDLSLGDRDPDQRGHDGFGD